MRAWQWRRGRGLSGTGGSRRAHRGQPPCLSPDESFRPVSATFRYQISVLSGVPDIADHIFEKVIQLPMSHKKADHWHRNWEAAGPILESRIQSAFTGSRRVTDSTPGRAAAVMDAFEGVSRRPGSIPGLPVKPADTNPVLAHQWAPHVRSARGAVSSHGCGFDSRWVQLFF